MPFFAIAGLALAATSVGIGAASAAQGAPGLDDEEIRKASDRENYAASVQQIKDATFRHLAKIAEVSTSYYARNRIPYTRAVQAHYAAILDPRFYQRSEGYRRGYPAEGIAGFGARYRNYYDKPLFVGVNIPYTRGVPVFPNQASGIQEPRDPPNWQGGGNPDADPR